MVKLYRIEPQWQKIERRIEEFETLFGFNPWFAALDRGHIAKTKIGGFPTEKQFEDNDWAVSAIKSFILQIHYSTHFDLCDCAITYLIFEEGRWRLFSMTS